MLTNRINFLFIALFLFLSLGIKDAQGFENFRRFSDYSINASSSSSAAQFIGRFTKINSWAKELEQLDTVILPHQHSISSIRSNHIFSFPFCPIEKYLNYVFSGTSPPLSFA